MKIDPDVLRLISERLSEDEEGIQMHIHAGLFHRLVEESLAYDTKVIKLTRKELHELGNRNQKPQGKGLQPAITSAYRAASGRSLDSIQSFDAKILGSFIEFFKKSLMEDEDFKNMARLKEIVDLVDASYLDINWALGALLYSFHETMRKRFFKVHFSDVDRNNRSYDEVLRELKKVLDKYNISYNERDFSLLKGKGDYRHKVIHEGHTSDDSDLQEILKTTARMMFWISELKTLHLSKAKDFQK